MSHLSEEVRKDHYMREWVLGLKPLVSRAVPYRESLLETYTLPRNI